MFRGEKMVTPESGKLMRSVESALTGQMKNNSVYTSSRNKMIVSANAVFFIGDHPIELRFLK
jgi:hypothetical protein